MASRALITAAAAIALFLGPTIGIAPASAHVRADTDNAVRGGHALVTFSVPNESTTGALTTTLTVTLPDVASASTESVPGWTARLDRDVTAGTVKSVTWTAAPNGGIPVDQFALFRISVTLPDANTVSFPAVQTYSDGLAVTWDQPPMPDGGEPEHPAPMLTLAEPTASPGQHTTAADSRAAGVSGAGVQSRPDNTARLLAGAALLVGAVGIAVALVRRRA